MFGCIILALRAVVVKLVNALASGASARKGLGVRVPSTAPLFGESLTRLQIFSVVPDAACSMICSFSEDFGTDLNVVPAFVSMFATSLWPSSTARCKGV